MSTPESDPGIYGGQRLDDRIDGRRNQLIEAAFTLLGEQGAPAVTMRAVIRKAGLSPRYFYESFADRAQLLVAVCERTMRNLQAGVDGAMSAASADPLEQTRAAITAVVDMLETDPRIARFLREALAEEALREHMNALLPRFIAATSLQLADESWYKRADPTTLQLDISALAGAMTHLFLDWTEGRLDATRQQFVDYCTDTVAGMVRRRGSPAGGLR